MFWLVSNLRSKKSAHFMEASTHNIHCHAAIEGKIVCRLLSALVNKPEVQYIEAVLLI
jgi:Na+-transporting NADH:ubiquinone oxidoreductase subunit NqrB